MHAPIKFSTGGGGARVCLAPSQYCGLINTRYIFTSFSGKIKYTLILADLCTPTRKKTQQKQQQKQRIPFYASGISSPKTTVESERSGDWMSWKNNYRCCMEWWSFTCVSLEILLLQYLMNTSTTQSQTAWLGNIRPKTALPSQSRFLFYRNLF